MIALIIGGCVLCRLIKLTSPNLNYAIGVGAFMLYVDVILLVVPTTNRDVISVLCNVRIASLLPCTIALHYHSVLWPWP